MAIVVQGAREARLYPLVGKYGGHVGYLFGNQWYMVAVEQRHRGDDFDLYWDEPPTDEYPFWEITFMGCDAWYYDRVKHGYRPVVLKGHLTFDGRDLLDRLLHVSPPMVDYSL